MTTHPDPFAPDVVAAVVAHMVEEHAEDTLVIARSAGGAVGAVAARLLDLDPSGLAIEVTDADGEVAAVRVPWGETPSDRAGIRHELVRLVDDAASAAAGSKPAP